MWPYYDFWGLNNWLRALVRDINQYISNTNYCISRLNDRDGELTRRIYALEQAMEKKKRKPKAKKKVAKKRK